jgi:hypothetical protein
MEEPSPHPYIGEGVGRGYLQGLEKEYQRDYHGV